MTAAHRLTDGVSVAIVQSGAQPVTGALRTSSIIQILTHPNFDTFSCGQTFYFSKNQRLVPWELHSLSFTIPDYDIALLPLEQPLVFSEKVSTLCIPESLNPTDVNKSSFSSFSFSSSSSSSSSSYSSLIGCDIAIHQEADNDTFLLSVDHHALMRMCQQIQQQGCHRSDVMRRLQQ